MIVIKRKLVVGLTVMISLVIGYLLQFGLTLPGHAAGSVADRIGIEPPIAIEQVELTAAIQPPGERPVPLPPAPPAQRLAAADVIAPLQMPADADQPALQGMKTVRVAADACDISMTATPGEAALVELALEAPCHAGQRVTIHHSGLVFAARTDAEGHLETAVPALAPAAIFIAAFDDGSGAVARTIVPDPGDYDRVGVQWHGTDAIALQARLTGPDGEADVLTPQMPGDSGEGAFLTLLGDPTLDDPALAQIYTFRARNASREGEVHLGVEVTVTADNCGRDIEAQTIEARDDDPVRVRDVTFYVPGCDARGAVLVIDDLLPDLRVAAR